MDEKAFDYLNVIPLVDVMLVLLTIVLTTSTFIATGGIEVQLPKAAASKPGTPKDGRVRVILTPKADDKAEAGKPKAAADDQEKLRPSTQLNGGAK